MNEYTPEKPIENFFVEINLRSRKWFLLCSYSPNGNLIADHLRYIGRGIDFYSSKYNSFIVLGDLNTEISNSFLEQFCASYNLKSLIKEPTCFKSVVNLSCIDLILTYNLNYFQNSGAYETGISTKQLLLFLRHFQKATPRIIKYRDYIHFDNNEFGDELIRELSSDNTCSLTIFLEWHEKK